jgi:hypothetical protein
MIKKWNSFINEEFIQDSDICYIEARMEEFSDLMGSHDVNFEYDTDQSELSIKFDNINFQFDIDELLLVKLIDGSVVFSENVLNTDEALDIIEKEIYNYLGVSETKLKKFNKFQKINELSVHDIVKMTRSGKVLDETYIGKLLAYVNDKFGGKYKVKNGELEGKDFIIKISKNSFVVEKEGQKKQFFQFDKIGKMIEFIKEK